MTLDWASGADEFQSTLSVRRATGVGLHGAHLLVISIHALREESDVQRPGTITVNGISIHALREESDFHWTCRPIWLRHFNPRSP